MAEGEVRMSVVLGDCSLEVSGSEDFVREQVQWFGAIASSRTNSQSDLAVTAHQPVEQTPDTASPPTPMSTIPENNPFPRVFRFDPEGIQLLPKKAPGGKTKQIQMRSIAMLYVLAKDIQGTAHADWLQIRSLCETYGCLDASNFGHMLADPSTFVLSGKGNARVVSLTHPGREEAEKLAAELNSVGQDMPQAITTPSSEK